MENFRNAVMAVCIVSAGVCIIENMVSGISDALYVQISNAGIICTEIETEVNISEDNSIFISKVTISADDFGTAAEIVRNSVGSNTEVVNGMG